MPTLDDLFLKVQKPSRYTGGELNSVMKDKAAVDVRCAGYGYGILDARA